MYIFRNEAIRWQISESTSHPMHFMLALTILEMSTFQIFYLKKVGQSHGVPFSQCGHSMANMKICNSGSMHVFASTHHFRDINTLNAEVSVILCIAKPGSR